MDRQAIFINCPFDDGYERLFIALVGSLVAVGLTPRSAIEIGGSEHSRVDKIRKLILDCGQSLHDLSLMTSNAKTKELPRFNMPFELGIAYEYCKRTRGRHIVGLLETQRHRHKKTLSDLAGYDAFIHGGTQKGIVHAVMEFVVSEDDRINYKLIDKVVRRLQLQAAALLSREQRSSVFNSHIYPMLVSEAALIRAELIES